MSICLPILLLLTALAPEPTTAQAPAGGDPSAALARIDVLLRQATLPSTDPAQRDKMLTEAAQQMQERIKESLTHEALEPKDVLGRLNLELKLAETEGLLRGGPYATRLLNLQGTREDRRQLAALAAGAMRRLRNLSAEIDGKALVWRGDYRKLVTAVPALEDLKGAVTYKTAWVALYRSLALEEGDERNSLLDEATALARPFAEDPSSTERGWSLLLMGIAQRERGAHDQAAASLQAAAAKDPILRSEARFQAARNLIEQGLALSRAGQAEAARKQWHAAQAAVQAFADAAADLPSPAVAGFAKAGARGEKDSPADDLKKVLLSHYLHQAMAQAADTAQGRREQEQQAQAELASFLTAHREAVVQQEFLQLVAEKYQSVRGQNDLGPVVLLALALTERLEASSAPAGSDSSPVEILRKAIASSDEVSLSVRPLALWRLATLEAQQGELRRAAERFSELVRHYGESSFARPAALNAVVCYSNLLGAQGRVAEEMEKKLRAEFVSALEALLDRWGDQADVAGWHFDLGWQYEKMAEAATREAAPALLDKALAAYEAVPATNPQHPRAHRRALGIQVRRLLAGPTDDPTRPAKAAALVEALRACAAQAESAGAEREWLDAGAWAELTAARMLIDVLGRRDEAMTLLAELPQRWAGSEIVAEAMEFHAAKLLEDGRVDEAIAAVEAVGKDHPDQALRLGGRVLEALRRRDGNGQGSSSRPSTGSDFGEPNRAGRPEQVEGRPSADGTLRLTEYLYRRCDAAEGPEKARWRQAYAEALLDANRPGEALELLLECRKQSQEDAAQRHRQIDAEVDARMSAVQQAREDLGKLRAMAAELLGELDAAGLKSQSSRGGWAIRGALAGLDGAVPSDRQQRLVEQLVSALQEGYRQLGQAKKQAIAARGDLLLDLARAYNDLGRFQEALELYGQLAEGIDAGVDPSAYWTAELGYCRCILASRGQDKRAMKSLAVRIAQLKQQDPNLGGMAEQFAAIQSQAVRAGE